ncbi:MAG: alanine dehydrogenase [Spirochaetaceae bacterium]|nr:MAG: alanine dehydrogenase [Spirochaetaceae bacterium]
MNIGVPKEVKRHEYRVGLTPHCVRAYTTRGHAVVVEHDAGTGSGYSDDEYVANGAKILQTAAEVFAAADMIVKVKEPLREEWPLLRSGQILYTYLHLAASAELTRALMDAGTVGIAYETIELPDRTLPCLTPMSQIAGRLSIQEGAKYLEKEYGGRGILLGGVPGVPRGHVVILGGGTVGTNACKIAVGIGATVTILDINARRLAYLDDIFGSSITTLYATEANIDAMVRDADIVVGAVLLPGETAPHLIRRTHLKTMKPGAVIVDVAIDQGGSAESSRPTTHDDPIFIEEGIVHYCVANMPGAVAYSSTIALTSVTLPFGLEIAENGVEKAMENPAIRKGLNVIGGACVHHGVARSCNIPYTEYP